jgi:purine-binding chemotaxis protein CheW
MNGQKKLGKEEELQLVAVKLSDEEYGIPIMQVQEIVRLLDTTRVPGLPDFIEGVINLRGKIIPLIDLRKRFKLGCRENCEEMRIVVVSIENQSIGLIVDAVSEVIRVIADNIEPIPPTISHIGPEYLTGVAKLEKRIIILLSLEKILNEIEKGSLTKIDEITQQNNQKGE